MENYSIGMRIRTVRRDRGLTAEKLAELIPIDATYLRQIEGDKRTPSLSMFINICRALHVSPNYLLSEELKESELDGFAELAEVWKKATPSQTEMVISILQTVLKQLNK